MYPRTGRRFHTLLPLGKKAIVRLFVGIKGRRHYGMVLGKRGWNSAMPDGFECTTEMLTRAVAEGGC